jgi:hypothetical protein
VQFTCTTTGSAANVPPNAGFALTGQATLNLVTAMNGVTVSNAGAIVGTDKWSDSQIRAACLAKLAANSVRGPRGAYVYAVITAVNASTGATVLVKPPVVSSSSHTGTVTVIVAPLYGGTMSADDVKAISDSIDALARPDAVTVVLQQATSVAVSGAITAYATQPDGLSASQLATWTAELQTQIEGALTTFFEAYPIGGLAKISGGKSGVWASAINGVVRAVNAAIFAVDGLTDPSATTPAVVLAPYQVATYAGTGPQALTVSVEVVSSELEQAA